MRLLTVLLLALPLAACADEPADRPGAAPIAPAPVTGTPGPAAAPAADPGHDGLHAYLAANPSYALHDESDFEPLEWMRRDGYLAPGANPYLLEGDFNTDGRADLAAIVFGPTSDRDDWGDSQEYRTRVLVFNGQPDGTARLVTGEEDGIMPLSSFLRPDEGGVGLWYGVAETDFSGHLVPEGDGYDLVIPEMGG